MININFSIKSFDYLHLLECEWMGKCISVNTTWDHPTQCLTYKCVLGESTGIARVSSDLWGRSRIKIPTVTKTLSYSFDESHIVSHFEDDL